MDVKSCFLLTAQQKDHFDVRDHASDLMCDFEIDTFSSIQLRRVREAIKPVKGSLLARNVRHDILTIRAAWEAALLPRGSDLLKYRRISKKISKELITKDSPHMQSMERCENSN